MELELCKSLFDVRSNEEMSAFWWIAMCIPNSKDGIKFIRSFDGGGYDKCSPERYVTHRPRGADVICSTIVVNTIVTKPTHNASSHCICCYQRSFDWNVQSFSRSNGEQRHLLRVIPKHRSEWVIAINSNLFPITIYFTERMSLNR